MSEQITRTTPSGTVTPAQAVVREQGRIATGNPGVSGGKDVPTRQRTEIPDLPALANKLNAASQNIGRDLRFQVDLKLGYAVIEVLDRETGEVIRQIPPEKAALLQADSTSSSFGLLDDLI